MANFSELLHYTVCIVFVKSSTCLMVFEFLDDNLLTNIDYQGIPFPLVKEICFPILVGLNYFGEQILCVDNSKQDAYHDQPRSFGVVIPLMFMNHTIDKGFNSAKARGVVVVNQPSELQEFEMGTGAGLFQDKEARDEYLASIFDSGSWDYFLQFHAKNLIYVWVASALAFLVTQRLSSPMNNVTSVQHWPFLNTCYCLQSEPSLAIGKNMEVILCSTLAWKLLTILSYATYHHVIKGFLLSLQHVKMDVVLHRKMVYSKDSTQMENFTS